MEKSSSEIYNSFLHLISGFADHANKSATGTYKSPQDKIPDIAQQVPKEYHYSKFNMKSIHLDHSSQNSRCPDCGHLRQKCAKMGQEYEQIQGNVRTQDSLTNLVRLSNLLNHKNTTENINKQRSSYQKYRTRTHIEENNERPLIIMRGSFTSCRTNNASSYINMIRDRYVPRIKSRSKTFLTDIETEYFARTENTAKNKLEDDLKRLLLQDYFKCKQKQNRVYTNSSSSKDVPDVLDEFYCNEVKHQQKELKRSGCSVDPKLTQIYSIHNKSSSHLAKPKNNKTETTITQMRCDCICHCNKKHKGSSRESAKKSKVTDGHIHEKQSDTQIESPNVSTKLHISTDTRLRDADPMKRFDQNTDMQEQLIQDMPEQTEEYTEIPYGREAPYIPTDTRLRAADSPKRFYTYADMQRQLLQERRDKKLYPDMAPELTEEYPDRQYGPEVPYIPTATRLRAPDSPKRFYTYEDMQRQLLQEGRERRLHPDMAPELTEEYTKRPYGLQVPYIPTETRLRVADSPKRFDTYADMQRQLLQERREKRLRPDMTSELTEEYPERKYGPKVPYIPTASRLRAADSPKHFDIYADMQRMPIQNTHDRRLHPDMAPEVIGTYAKRPNVPREAHIRTDPRLRTADSAQRFDINSDMYNQPFQESRPKRLQPVIAPELIEEYSERPYFPGDAYKPTETSETIKPYSTYSDMQKRPFQERRQKIIRPDMATEPADTAAKRPYLSREPYASPDKRSQVADTTSRFDTFSGMQMLPFQDTREERLHPGVAPETLETYTKRPSFPKEPYLPADIRLRAAEPTKRYDTYPEMKQQPFQDTRERILHPDGAPELTESYTKGPRAPYKPAEIRLGATDSTKRFDSISDEQRQPYQDTRGKRLHTHAAAVPQPIDTITKRPYVPKESYITTETRLPTTDSTKRFDTISDMQKQPVRDSRERRLPPDVAAPDLIDKYTERPYVPKEQHIPTETRYRAADSIKPTAIQREPILETHERRLQPDVAPELAVTYTKRPSVPYIPLEKELEAADLTRPFETKQLQRQPIQETPEGRLPGDMAMAPEKIDMYAKRPTIPRKPYTSSDTRLPATDSTKRFDAYTRRPSVPFIPAETRLRADDSTKRFNTYPDMQRQPIQDRREIRLHPDMVPEAIDPYAERPGIPKERYIPADTRLRAADSTKRIDTYPGMRRPPIQDRREIRSHPDMVREIIDPYAERPSVPKERYIPADTRLRAADSTTPFDTYPDIQRQPIQDRREIRLHPDIAPEIMDPYAERPGVPKQRYIPADSRLRAVDSTKPFDTYPDMPRQPINDRRELRLHPDMAPEIIDPYAERPDVPKYRYMPADNRFRAVDSTKPTYPDMQRQPIQDRQQIKLQLDMAPDIMDPYAKRPGVPKERYIPADTRLPLDTYPDMQRQPIQDRREIQLHPHMTPETIDPYAERRGVPKERYIPADTRLRAVDSPTSFDTYADIQRQPIQDTREKRFEQDAAVPIDTYTCKPSVLQESYMPAETRLQEADFTKGFDTKEFQRQPIQDTREKRPLSDVAAPGLIEPYTQRPSVQKKPYIPAERKEPYKPEKPLDTITDIQKETIPDRREKILHPGVEPMIDTYTEKSKEPFVTPETSLPVAASTNRADKIPDIQKQPIQEMPEGILLPDTAPEIVDTHTKRPSVQKEPLLTIPTDAKLQAADSTKRLDAISDMQKHPTQDKREESILPDVAVPATIDKYAKKPSDLKESDLPAETRLPVAEPTKDFDTVDLQKQPIQDVREDVLHPDVARIIDPHTEKPTVLEEPYPSTESKVRTDQSTILSDMQKQPTKDVTENRLHSEVVVEEPIDTHVERPGSKDSFTPTEPKLRAPDSTKGLDAIDLPKHPVQVTPDDKLHADVAPSEFINTDTKKSSYVIEPSSKLVDTTADTQKQPIQDTQEENILPDKVVPEPLDAYTEKQIVPEEPLVSPDSRLQTGKSSERFDAIPDMQKEPIHKALHPDIEPEIIDTHIKRPSVHEAKQPIQDTRKETPHQDVAPMIDSHAEKSTVIEEPYRSTDSRLPTGEPKVRSDITPDTEEQPIEKTRKEISHTDRASVIDADTKLPTVLEEPYVSTDTKLQAADTTTRIDIISDKQKQPSQEMHEEKIHPDMAPPELMEAYTKRSSVLKEPYASTDTKLQAGDSKKPIEAIDVQKQPIQDTREERLLPVVVAPEFKDTYAKRPSVPKKPYVQSKTRLPATESTVHLDTITDVQKQPIQDRREERFYPDTAKPEIIDTYTGKPTIQEEPFMSADIPDRPKKRKYSDVAPDLVDTYTERPDFPGEPYSPTDTRLRAPDSRGRFDTFYDKQKRPIQDTREEWLHSDKAPTLGDAYTRKTSFPEEPYISVDSRLRPEESIVRFDTISDMQRRPLTDRRQERFYSDAAPQLVDTYTERPHFQGQPYTPIDVRLRAADPRERFDTFYDMQQRPIQDMREERLHPDMAPELSDAYTRKPIFLEEPYIAGGSRLRPDESDLPKRPYSDRRERRYYSDVAPELEDAYTERPHFPVEPYIPTDVRLRTPKLIDTYTERPSISREPFIPTDTRLQGSDSTEHFDTYSGMRRRPFQYRRQERLYSDVAPEPIDTYTERPYAPRQPHTAIDSRLREESYLHSDLQQTAGLSPMQRVRSRQTSTEKQSEQRSILQDTQYFDRSNMPRQDMTDLDDIQRFILIRDPTCIVVKGGRLLSNEGVDSEVQNNYGRGLTMTFAPPCRKSRLTHKCDESSQCRSKKSSSFKLRSARVPKIDSKTNQAKTDHISTKRAHKTHKNICECQLAPKNEVKTKVSKTDATPCRRHQNKCAKGCQCKLIQKKMPLQSENGVATDNEYQLRNVQYQPEQVNRSVFTDGSSDNREPKPDCSRCQKQQNKCSRGCQCRYTRNKTIMLAHVTQPVKIDNEHQLNLQEPRCNQSTQSVCNHYPSCERIPTCLIKHYMDLVSYCVHVPLCTRMSLCCSTKSGNDLRSMPFTNLAERNSIPVVKRVIPPPCMAVQTCDQLMWISDGERPQKPESSIIRDPTFSSSNLSGFLFSKIFRSKIPKSSESSSGKNKFLNIFRRHKRNP